MLDSIALGRHDRVTMSFPALTGPVLLASGGTGLYIAAKALGDAVGDRPARLAAVYALPVSAVALGASVLGRSDIAVVVTFTTAVAVILLAGGVAIALTDRSGRANAVTPGRVAALLLPAAFVVFLVGFSGRFSGVNVAVLLIEAGAIMTWRWTGTGPGSPAFIDVPEAADRPRGVANVLSVSISTMQVVLAIALAAVGAWAAVRGTEQAAAAGPRATAGLVAVVLLGPMLALPAIGGAVDLAAVRRSADVLTAVVAVAIFCLCVLLPAVAVEGRFHPIRLTLLTAISKVKSHTGTSAVAAPGVTATTAFFDPPATAARAAGSATRASTRATTGPASAVEPPAVEDSANLWPAIPLAAWRVDTVAVIAAGLLLLPAALGRWPLRRPDGLALVAGYLLYLAVTLLSAYQS